MFNCSWTSGDFSFLLHLSEILSCLISNDHKSYETMESRSNHQFLLSNSLTQSTNRFASG